MHVYGIIVHDWVAWAGGDDHIDFIGYFSGLAAKVSLATDIMNA